MGSSRTFHESASMARWGLLWGLALLLWASCAVHAPRSTGMGQASEVESSVLGLQEIEGKVARIDLAEGVILIHPDALPSFGEASAPEPLELVVGDGTLVYLEGGVGTLAEIEEGSEIRATFTENGKGRIAAWVEVPRAPDPEQDAPPTLQPKDPGAASQRD